MAIAQLKKKPVEQVSVKLTDNKIEKFIGAAGEASSILEEQKDDHRLTLRIPCWLMEKIDKKRKERLGKISRNLFILETLDKATKK